MTVTSTSCWCMELTTNNIWNDIFIKITFKYININKENTYEKINATLPLEQHLAVKWLSKQRFYLSLEFHLPESVHQERNMPVEEKTVIFTISWKNERIFYFVTLVLTKFSHQMDLRIGQWRHLTSTRFFQT